MLMFQAPFLPPAIGRFGILEKVWSTSTLHLFVQSLKFEDENRRTILEWLSPADARKTQKEVFEMHQAGTGQWLLNRPEFIEWLQGSRCLLWCYGDRM